MKDNSEYIIYSSVVRSRVSGDSLIVFNKRDLSNIEIIPIPEIKETVVISDIMKDSPFWSIIKAIFWWQL